MRRTIRQQDVADDDGACCPNRPSVWQGQPGGLGDGSRWSFRGKGERPPGGRVGWPSTPEGCQTWRCGGCSIRSGSIVSRLGLAPLRDAGHHLRRYPEVAAPHAPATSGYPLATLRVDQSRMSKLCGALRTARPTFTRAGDLGNTPGNRRILSAPKMAPTEVGGYSGVNYPR